MEGSTIALYYREILMWNLLCSLVLTDRRITFASKFNIVYGMGIV